MASIRVDGNDVFAVYNSVKKAREYIIKEKRPVVIEAMTYRVGNHSTSDFAERYRDEKEMTKWKELIEKFSNPIARLEKYLLKKGLVGKDDAQKYRDEAKKQVRDALKVSNETRKPAIDELFNDVLENLSPNLVEQKRELKEHIKKYED